MQGRRVKARKVEVRGDSLTYTDGGRRYMRPVRKVMPLADVRSVSWLGPPNAIAIAGSVIMAGGAALAAGIALAPEPEVSYVPQDVIALMAGATVIGTGALVGWIGTTTTKKYEVVFEH